MLEGGFNNAREPVLGPVHAIHEIVASHVIPVEVFAVCRVASQPRLAISSTVDAVSEVRHACCVHSVVGR